MKVLLSMTLAAGGVVLASRSGAREHAARFREDVRQGMDARETQLREMLATDTHLTLPGERLDARAIEGRQRPASDH